MSAETPEANGHEQRDELDDLVAYLDGELDDPSIELMERRLVTDDPLRRYADSLDETWHLLDSLGDVEASDTFSRKTLSSLETIEPASESRDQGGWSVASLLKQKNAVPAVIGWTVFGFLLASIGLTVGRLSALPRPGNDDAEVLEHLPMLKRYHQYRLVPSVEFLENLKLAPLQPDPAETDQ